MSPNKDSQQLNLFGGKPEPIEEDKKIYEGRLRNNVEIYTEKPTNPKFPPLVFPYRWERLKAIADTKKISLKPIIVPVYEGIKEIDEQLQRVEETEMGRLFIICGESGSGKTTFLNSLGYFIDDLYIKSVIMKNIDSTDLVQTTLDAAGREPDQKSLIVLEGKETPGALKDDEIDNLLAALNVDFRTDSGSSTLFVIPTPSQAVANSISQRAAAVGKMTSPNNPYYFFNGPKKDTYVQITNDTLRAFNQSRTLLDYGIDEKEALGIAEASKSIGDFMENCYEEIQRERKRRKNFLLSSKRKRIHVWMIFCTLESNSRSNHDIIRSLSLSNNQHVQIDRMLTGGDSKEIRYWEDKQGEFARAIEYLDLRVMYLPMRTANAAFVAYGDSKIIDKLEEEKLIKRQATTRESAQKSLSGTAIWAFYNGKGFVDRDVTKRGKLTDTDRKRFKTVIDQSSSDKPLNRIIADVLRDLIKDPDVSVVTELPLNDLKSLTADIAIVTPTDVFCLEMKWRSSELVDSTIIAQTTSRIRDFATEFQDLKNLLEQ